MSTRKRQCCSSTRRRRGFITTALVWVVLSGCSAPAAQPAEAPATLLVSPSAHRGAFRDGVTLVGASALRVEHRFGIDEAHLQVQSGAAFPTALRVRFVGFASLEGFGAQARQGASTDDLPVQRSAGLELLIDLRDVSPGATISLHWVDAYRR